MGFGSVAQRDVILVLSPFAECLFVGRVLFHKQKFVFLKEQKANQVFLLQLIARIGKKQFGVAKKSWHTSSCCDSVELCKITFGINMTTDPRAAKSYDAMNDSRAIKAYDAMKNLGISKEEPEEHKRKAPVEDNDKPPKTQQKCIKPFQTSSSHKLLSQRRLSDDERMSSLPSMAARGKKSYSGAASSAGLYSKEPSHQRKNMSSDHHQKKITTHNGSLGASNGNLSIKSLSKGSRQALAEDKKKSVRYVDDITKGSENVKVSLLDETESEDFPKFNYIPGNVIYQCANVNISLARIADEGCCADCSGDCLSLSFPCACSQETGGEFAYSSNGLLKEKFLTDCINEPQAHHYVYCKECPIERSKNESKPEPCRGHLVRKFIKECWRKCGCDMQCGNRVVQRGLSRKLQVFLTDQGKGWGVRTLEDLPMGSFVCEYAGEILTNTELYDRIVLSTGNDRHTYPVTLDADWGSEVGLKDEEALCLDATHNGNVARFINHRNVSAYEELTWDYGIDFDDHTHPIKAFKCCCGSAHCRDKKQKGTKSAKTKKLKHTNAH
ncbi:hypothetical protein RYX36_019477 [Vicia faba]